MLSRPRFVLTALAILFAGMGWAAPRQAQESPVSRIFAANAGDQTIEIRVERSRAGNLETDVFHLTPGEIAEVRRSASEEVRIPDHRDLLLVTAPAGFDPAALRFGFLDRPERAVFPGAEEVRVPLREKIAVPRLSQGETASSQVLWTGAEPTTLHLSLHGNAAAEVRALRPDGSILGWVALSASRDLDVSVDLGGFLRAKGYGGVVRQELIVRRGQVSTAMAGGVGAGGGLQRIAEALIVGNAEFSHSISFTQIPFPALYYTVTNGPASTCGELNTYRNNSWLFGPGWLCTDASGYSRKGPWTSAPTDQTDDPAFIRWPDASTTNNRWHIWDISCPNIQITSTPPSAWSGTVTDTVFGACFRSGYASVATKFLNVTTGYYWDPTYGYGWPAEKYHYGVINGMPSCNTTWSQPSHVRPPALAHTPGQRYRWTACVSDGGCRACQTVEFTY